jgi:hypothetical protein
MTIKIKTNLKRHLQAQDVKEEEKTGYGNTIVLGKELFGFNIRIPKGLSFLYPEGYEDCRL